MELVTDSLFILYFRRGFCPLNSILSERLMSYLVKNHQLNDFTLALFSSNVTSLTRLILNVKYLSRLQCHILREHAHLTEVELIFKDSNPTRTNQLFYQYLCPSIESKFEEIARIYGSLILQSIQLKSKTASPSFFERSFSSFSEEFSHQKLFHIIFHSFHPSIFERLKVLKISHFKFFAAYPLTPSRKSSHVDMSPLTKCSSHSTSIDVAPANFRLMMKFSQLTSLNLNHTDIKNHCLEYLCHSLIHLESLDISSCRSITLFHPLLTNGSKWKWLNLYNCTLHLQRSPTIYQILLQCENLEYLDLSQDNPNAIAIPSTEFDLNELLRHPRSLTRLKQLDLSGHKTLQLEALRDFLRRHPQLEFLGLFLSSERSSTLIFDRNDRRYTFDIPDLSSADLNEEQMSIYERCLIEALKRYHHRSAFVQKILYYIFALTRSYSSNNQILLLELILHAMSIHHGLATVQMASTACIYNLTRTPITEQINVRCLGKLVQTIIQVMEHFPTQQQVKRLVRSVEKENFSSRFQLQKNCLLTLCSDRILHEPKFDFYRLASLVMINLQNSTDLAIIQPGVAILALLTTRVKRSERNVFV